MNWSKLKPKVSNPSSSSSKAKLLNAKLSEPNHSSGADAFAGTSLSRNIKEKYVALDCEMVGIGIDGKISALARCCVVDFDGEVLYDEYVRPPGFVTDFRTKWSGVRKQDLRQGKAVTLQEVFIC